MTKPTLTDTEPAISLTAYNPCAVGHHSHDGGLGRRPHGTARLCPSPPERYVREWKGEGFFF